MKINRKDFIEMLERASFFTPKNSTLPILSNVFLEYADGVFSVFSTNLNDYSICIKYNNLISDVSEFSFIVNPFDVLKVLKGTKSIDIDFDLEEYKFTIILENDKYDFSCLDKDNYPGKPEISDCKSLEIPCSILFDMLFRTSFAVSDEYLRPTMMGVYFDVKDRNFKVVATDGHRLGVAEYYPFESEFEIGTIVSKLVSDFFVKKCKKIRTNVKIFFGEEVTGFSFDNISLYSRVVEGQYPDYQRVIPKEFSSEFIFNRKEFITKLQSVRINKECKIRLLLDDSKCSFSVSEESFDGIVNLDSCEYFGEKIEFGFNRNYVLEILNHIDSEKVLMKFNTPVRPVLFLPIVKEIGFGLSKSKADYKLLLMPIRLVDK